MSDNQPYEKGKKVKKLSRFLIGASLVSFLPVSVNATTLEEAERLLDAASGGAGRVVEVFDGPPGLTGMVILDSKKGIKFVGWTDGHYVFLGPVFDGKDEITSVATRKALPSDPAKFQAVLERSGYGFVVGEKGPIVDMLADPNCVFCYLSYQSLSPEIAKGKFRLRVFPIAILDPVTSLIRGEIILSSNDPEWEFNMNENHFIVATEQGGIPIPKRGTPFTEKQKEAVRKVMINTSILTHMSNRVQSPIFLYQGAIHRGEMTRKEMESFLGGQKTGQHG